MNERILKEIEDINNCIDEWKELLSCAEDSDEEREYFNQIRKYEYYKKALNQVLNNFPIEVGGY